MSIMTDSFKYRYILLIILSFFSFFHKSTGDIKKTSMKDEGVFNVDGQLIPVWLREILSIKRRRILLIKNIRESSLVCFEQVDIHDLFGQTLVVFRNIFYLDSYLPAFMKTKRGTIIAVNSLESASPLFSLCVSGSLRKSYRVRSVLGKDSDYEFESGVGEFFYLNVVSPIQGVLKIFI